MGGRGPYSSKERCRVSDFRQHGLRLPFPSLVRLHVLTHELRSMDIKVTTGAVARGLCLFALALLQGDAGPEAACAFRVVACDPTSIGAYRALKAFRALLVTEEEEPSTKPMRGSYEIERPAEDLRSQALRLPNLTHAQIEETVHALRALGFDVSRGGVTRGLCMLALHLASGDAGAEIARVLSIAVANPTLDGARYAVEVIRPLLEQEPPTRRDPCSFPEPTSDPTPPSLPSACAA